MRISTRLHLFGGAVLLFNLWLIGHYDIKGMPVILLTIGFAIAFEYFIVHSTRRHRQKISHPSSQVTSTDRFDAFEQFQVDLDKEKDRLDNKRQETKEAEEMEKYRRWKKGSVAASRYLNAPVPAELYAKKREVSLSDVIDLVGKGELKEATVEGDLFVEDVPPPRE